MKYTTIFPVIIFLIFVSCNDQKAQDMPQNENPKALEDKSSSPEFVSKRSAGDLLESLYNELAEQTSELKQFEQKIDILSESRNDSTSAFEKYQDKNEQYYNSANRHITELKDSVLREEMKNLVENGLTRYNSSISKHTALLNSIKKKNIALDDLHTVLKLARTLPLMDKYQKNNLPPAKPLEAYLDQLDKTIKQADVLIKQP